VDDNEERALNRVTMVVLVAAALVVLRALLQ
jgi:hypothetical protein